LPMWIIFFKECVWTRSYQARISRAGRGETISGCLSIARTSLANWPLKNAGTILDMQNVERPGNLVIELEPGVEHPFVPPSILKGRDTTYSRCLTCSFDCYRSVWLIIYTYKTNGAS
jgi:hypothetical protein